MIIYGGDAHIKMIIKCLKNLFGDKFFPEYSTLKNNHNKLIKLSDLHYGKWISGYGYAKYEDIFNLTKIDELFTDFYQ